MVVDRIIVRRAEVRDAESVVDMIVRLKIFNEELSGMFRTVQDVRERAREYFMSSLDGDGKILLVADADGEVAGFIRVELVDRIFYEPRVKALITDIYVRPSYRRSSVGHILIEAATREARRMGAGMISAIYPIKNYVASEFYRKMGFEELQVEVFKEL